MKIVSFITYDSYVGPISLFQSRKPLSEFEHHTFLISKKAKLLSARQLASHQLLNFSQILFSELASCAALKEADLVLVGAGGKPANDICLAVKAVNPNAKTVCFFPGICLVDHYWGLLSRINADYLLLNTEDELDDYVGLCKVFGFDPSNAIVAGYPFRTNQIGRKITSFDDIQRITLFDQNVIPATVDARVALVEGLAKLAKSLPDKEILIKVRSKKGEKSSHRALYHIQSIASPLRKFDNVSFVVESMSSILPKTDLALSVSSTALLEAGLAGVRFGSIMGLGVSDLNKNSYFLGSDTGVTFESLANRQLPALPKPDWANRYMKSSEDVFHTVLDDMRSSTRGLRPHFELGEIQKVYYVDPQDYISKKIGGFSKAARSWLATLISPL